MNRNGSNRIDLIQSEIKKIPFINEGQKVYWDATIPGFGLLVGKRSKTFFIQVDVKDSTKKKGFRTVKKAIGRYGDLTPEQARKLVNGHHDQFGDFVVGKRHELKLNTDNGRNITLKEMVKAYFTEKRTHYGEKHKLSTVTGYTRIIEHHFASWLHLTLPEIAKLTPETIIARHTQIENHEDHGPFAARNAFVMLTAVINYATVKYPSSVRTNPFNVLRLGKHIRPVKRRTECLAGEDFRVFHDGIKKFNEITRDAYLMCLFHGLRATSEAASLRWEYKNENGKILGGIDLEKEEMRIPDTKNRLPLHVPLCRQSLAILKRRQAKNPEGNPFVFPSLPRPQCVNKTGHVRLMAAELRAKTGLNLTVHALRRSFITTGKKLKLHEEADRLTNHVDSSVTGRHYDGREVDDLRQPLQAIVNEIERLMIEGVKAKVVQLATANAKDELPR